jgi:hypothetical protein
VQTEIVEDHDVAWLEGRDKELLDIGAEPLAVDGSVEQAGRVGRACLLHAAARPHHRPVG